MSDFFSNLAGRLLGVSEVVRPRLPALFETPEREAKLSVEEASPAQALPPRDRDGTHEAAAPPPANAPRNEPLDFAPRDRPEKAVRSARARDSGVHPTEAVAAGGSIADGARRSRVRRPETESAFRRNIANTDDEPAPTKRKTERAATNAPPTQTAEPVAKRDEPTAARSAADANAPHSGAVALCAAARAARRGQTSRSTAARKRIHHPCLHRPGRNPRDRREAITTPREGELAGDEFGRLSPQPGQVGGDEQFAGHRGGDGDASVDPAADRGHGS